MKKLNILIAILAGFLFFLGCEEMDKEPVLDMNQATGPQFSSPAGGGSYELTQDEMDNEFATFSWSNADYGFQASITYILEMDAAGNNFAGATQLTSSEDNSITMTVGEFNDILLKKGVETGEPLDLEFRVKSSINDNVNDLMSSVLTLTVTAFSNEAPPLYMLGDATRAGWDNMNPIEMVSLGGGVYELVDSLFSDLFLKFLTTPGQWAPQYGTDGAGTWEAGNLVLRPTEAQPDPAAISSPPEDGIYRITVDIVNLTYTIEETGLYMLGDATTAGWDNANPLPMELIEPYKFRLTTDLSADLYYKFITNPGAWAPMYGTDDSGTEEGGNLVYRPTEGDPDPASIQNITGGTKTVECDLINLTYTVTAAK